MGMYSRVYSRDVLEGSTKGVYYGGVLWGCTKGMY